jgi:hypothetical protein
MFTSPGIPALLGIYWLGVPSRHHVRFHGRGVAGDVSFYGPCCAQAAALLSIADAPRRPMRVAVIAFGRAHHELRGAVELPDDHGAPLTR